MGQTDRRTDRHRSTLRDGSETFLQFFLLITEDYKSRGKTMDNGKEKEEINMRGKKERVRN